MLIDTHSHVSFPQYDADRAAVVDRAFSAGIVQMIDVGCDLASSRRSIDFARGCRKDRVFATVGVHPHQAKDWDDETRAALGDLAHGAPDCVVAVGECGLDFFRNLSPREDQEHAFREQVRLAWELDLPLVLHIRDAHEDALALLGEIAKDAPAGKAKPFRGVSHCYSGDADQAARYDELGFSIALGGVITFGNADPLRRTAAAVPLDQILLETDCPYMAPAPARGQRNEPALMVHVAERLAAVKGVAVDELHAVTTANARALFALPAPADDGDVGHRHH